MFACVIFYARRSYMNVARESYTRTRIINLIPSVDCVSALSCMFFLLVSNNGNRDIQSIDQSAVFN